MSVPGLEAAATAVATIAALAAAFGLAAWRSDPPVLASAPTAPDVDAPTHSEAWLREHAHEEPGGYKQRCPDPECEGPAFTAAARHCPWCGTEVYDVQ